MQQSQTLELQLRENGDSLKEELNLKIEQLDLIESQISQFE